MREPHRFEAYGRDTRVTLGRGPLDIVVPLRYVAIITEILTGTLGKTIRNCVNLEMLARSLSGRYFIVAV